MQKAKDWRGDLEILLVSACSEQIFDINHTSSYILKLPFACLATNSLGDGPMSYESPLVWLPQIPSCNSSRSNSDTSGCMHSRYSPEKDRLYSFWSSDS